MPEPRCALWALRAGVLHCDLKTSNILLSDRHTPIITDFGLSQKTNGTVKLQRGTALYNAPEILMQQVCSKATDVWAFGCIVVCIANKVSRPYTFTPLVLRAAALRCSQAASQLSAAAVGI